MSRDRNSHAISVMSPRLFLVNYKQTSCRTIWRTVELQFNPYKTCIFIAHEMGFIILIQDNTLLIFSYQTIFVILCDTELPHCLPKTAHNTLNDLEKRSVLNSRRFWESPEFYLLANHTITFYGLVTMFKDIHRQVKHLKYNVS